jgi:hypothetical protein
MGFPLSAESIMASLCLSFVCIDFNVLDPGCVITMVRVVMEFFNTVCKLTIQLISQYLYKDIFY